MIFYQNLDSLLDEMIHTSSEEQFKGNQELFEMLIDLQEKKGEDIKYMNAPKEFYSSGYESQLYAKYLKLIEDKNLSSSKISNFMECFQESYLDPIQEIDERQETIQKKKAYNEKYNEGRPMTENNLKNHKILKDQLYKDIPEKNPEMKNVSALMSNENQKTYSAA